MQVLEIKTTSCNKFSGHSVRAAHFLSYCSRDVNRQNFPTAVYVTLDQHIGVRIPGGSQSSTFRYSPGLRRSVTFASNPKICRHFSFAGRSQKCP